MELKVVCQCGQKYKFDVEPVNGRMPFTVNCPVCNSDGTPTANAVLAEKRGTQPINLMQMSAPPPPPMIATAVPPPLRPRPGMPMRPLAPVLQEVKPVNEFNLGLGILGAVLGSGVGAGLMYAFFMAAHFRFPLMGTGIGALAGLGARVLYKGTDSTLGVIAGGIALLATSGTLYLMYGDMAGMFILSIAVSAYVAYRIAG